MRRHRPNEGPEGTVCVGAVTGAVGLKGEVRIKTFTDDPLAVGDYGPLKTNSGLSLEVTVVRALKSGLVAARIGGVTDRTAAEELKGTALYLDRDLLPDADEDEFYHADLIGLAAVDETGRELGIVIALHDFGAGDLVELKLAESGKPVLVPFTKETVPRVDLPAGQIVIAPVPGLLDVETDGKTEEE